MPNKKTRQHLSLRAWRLAQQLTQGAAAAKLGVSQGYYSRLEHGHRAPQARLGKAIADKTRIPLETILGL